MNVRDALMFGGYNPAYVLYSGEYYRLITANFIHFGLLHLVMNCYSMLGIGMFVEVSLGVKNYFILIVASALSTTGIPYILYLINGYGLNTISGGVSGVIFGLIGALGALALVHKDIFSDIFRQLAPNVIIMLFISVIVPSISLSGHLSGLIGGFIVTYIMLIKKNIKHKKSYKDLLN